MFLFLYNFLLNLFLPFILIAFIFRVISGKEHKKRFIEKFGYTKKTRLKTRLIWFHACSVGEVKSIENLVKEFEQRNYSLLITTSTLLSAKYVKVNFSSKINHQFLPLDLSFSTQKFLTNWKPDFGIFVESELWPNLIFKCKKMNITLILLQARFSEKSLIKWSLFQNLLKDILSKFNLIVAQSEREKKKIYSYTKIMVHDIHNLKNSSKTLKIEKDEVERIKRKIRKSFVVTALSTHKGEEEILLESLKKILSKINNIILIIQPRHPNRANQIKSLIRKYNFNFRQKSVSEYPKENTSVYLADTFGESGTLISASDLIILGGTLVPVGGHNIIEPAQMSKGILIGNYYNKIQDTVEKFKEFKSIKLVRKDKDLSKFIINLYNNKGCLKSLGKKAFAVTKTYPKMEKKIVNKIISLKKHENSKILVQR